MKKVDAAVSCFKEGLSCSQAILSTYGQELGLDRVTALKVSASFGGGMARMGETCGAVTGAFMVIGLKYAVDKSSKDKIYSIVKRFVDEFKTRNKSIVCKELLGCDISVPEGMETIKKNKLVDAICPKLVKDAAEILDGILKEAGQ